MSLAEIPCVRTGLEIAVIGMAGRFPGAANVSEFWENLCAGVESISFFSPEEIEGTREGQAGDPRYVPARGVLEGAELFDASFFGYSPREAEIMDPQQRLFLECAWQALEDAGHDPAAYRHPIGVFGGAGLSSYVFNVLTRPDVVRSLGWQQVTLANDKDYLCTRVSYKLGLEGPSVSVQTACSTSLVAVHLACQALLSGECDMAIAGGVSVSFPQKVGYLHQEGGILSPDGHCRAFDARARGTVAGHGVGVVVLKRLESALADGDEIRALILGSAINNDGSLKAGFTAPREEGQAAVIRAAHRMAEIDLGTVSYIEAHGTATEVGDPIELAALSQVFQSTPPRRKSCAIGSVKTNIGHLDAAAGIAGLIKAVLCLEHRRLPPSLHFERPNPEIDFESGPFYVSTRLEDWPAGETPRRAGVSAFGLGGTNAHVVLQEPPPAPVSKSLRRWHLLVLSARSADALEKATANLAKHLRHRLEGEVESLLADIAFTCQVGRRRFTQRRALVCRNAEEAVRILEEREPGRLLTLLDAPEEAKVAFLFPGLGDQYPGMGQGLYETEHVFREELDRCAAILAPQLAADVRDVLFAGRTPATPSADAARTLDLKALLGQRGAAHADSCPLAQTTLVQPALFALEYALARLWMSWGIQPCALLGYSLGEYVAACIAGVLSLEEALELVVLRARLIDSLPPGGMLAIPLSEAQLYPLLGEGLWLAAQNGPAICVVAGTPEGVSALEERLSAEGVACRRIQTSHALHSPLMQPIADALRAAVERVNLQPPRIPCLSNVTGGWLSAVEATDPNYWVRHLCHPVRLGDAFGTLAGEPCRILLEAGPGQSLGSLALQSGASARWTALSSLPHELDGQPDENLLARTLGKLWLAGASIDWAARFSGEARRRVAIPTYPFERVRFWLEPRPPAAAPPPSEDPARISDPAEWFFVPSWKRAVRQPVARIPQSSGSWLLLIDSGGIGCRLAERLRAERRDAVEVLAGEGFGRLGERLFTIRPGEEADCDALLSSIPAKPERIVHLWSLGPKGGDLTREVFEEAQSAGFLTLVGFAQALAKRAGSTEICVVTSGLFGVEHGDRIQPEKATLLGPARVVPQEHSDLSCRVIDVRLDDPPGELVDRLIAELTGGEEPVVACRGPHRWIPTVEPIRLEPPDEEDWTSLREKGVYLLTGGLGGIGSAIARFLARTRRARLVLVGRSPHSDRSERLVEELESAGSEVLVLAADVADEHAMRRAFAQVRARFGRIDGVFHAAGVPGGGLMQLKEKDAMMRLMSPKTVGALVLEKLLREEPPDFVVLFSSLTSLTGGIGQVEYCAANLFLDALALRHAGELPRRIAIDWCEWQWSSWGEASAALGPRIQEELARQRRVYGLAFEEGIDALCRVLAHGLSHVGVSTRGLAPLLRQEQSLREVLDELAHARSVAPERHPRPVLGVPLVAPTRSTERVLADLWQDLLGVSEVGVHDDFFQLGGHSLLGLQLLSQVRELFLVELPLHSLFEAPTVAELAVTVERLGSDPTTTAVLPEIRSFERQPADAAGAEPIEPDALSDDEVEQLLTQILAQSGGGTA